MKNSSYTLLGWFFGFLSLVAFMSYQITTSIETMTLAKLLIGIFIATLFYLVLWGSTLILPKLPKHAILTTCAGIGLGYLLGKTVLLILQEVFGPVHIHEFYAHTLKGTLFLFSLFIGIYGTRELEASLQNEKPDAVADSTHGQRLFVLDVSALIDPRLIDLASSGFLDKTLLVSKHLVEMQKKVVENGDESQIVEAKKGLDTLNKLENIPQLDLKIIDHLPCESLSESINHLACKLGAYILTSELPLLEQKMSGDIRWISLHQLAKAMKPITQAGERIDIKIQRYGKEARQGVGYLEDGTMVVINGGAKFIGETIKAQVLSVKHTSTGQRMIFCNAIEERTEGEEELSHLENAPNKYFALSDK